MTNNKTVYHLCENIFGETQVDYTLNQIDWMSTRDHVGWMMETFDAEN